MKYSLLKAWKKVISFIILIPILLFIILPYVVMISTSIKSSDEVMSANPTLFPEKVQWFNFIEVWSIVPLKEYFLNSLIVASLSSLLALLLAIPTSYALARMRFKGKKFFLYLFLVTQMFPPIVLIIGLFKMMANLNLLDTLFSLIITNAALTLAFAVWLLTGFFKTIPYEIEEAANIDGANMFTKITKIIIPLAKPGIITVVLFSFIMSWNEFLFAYTFISSPEKNLITVGIYTFIGRYAIQWEYLMAASLLAVVPVIILFLIIKKHLVSGLTSGSVK